MTYLNDTQLAAVQRWLPLYLEAERKIGVPWPLLAALHYRESNFAARTQRVGSAFQFDPPLAPAQVRAYGAQYGIMDLTEPETDVRTAVLCAAAFLQGKVAGRGQPPLTPGSSEAECADAAWSYNGRAYGSWQRSPYVSNDPQNGLQMRITGTVPDLKNPAQRVRIDQPDTRPGVLAIMRELRQRVPLTPTPPPAPADERDAMLIVGPEGRFVPVPGPRFVVPYPALVGYSNGKWWIRPATPEELAGGIS